MAASGNFKAYFAEATAADVSVVINEINFKLQQSIWVTGCLAIQVPIQAMFSPKG